MLAPHSVIILHSPLLRSALCSKSPNMGILSDTVISWLLIAYLLLWKLLALHEQ